MNGKIRPRNNCPQAIAASLLLYAATLASCSPGKQAQINLIPKPVKMELASGYLPLDSAAVEDGSPLIRYNLTESFADPNPESYKLTVGKKGVDITAGSDIGLFYGKQTLRQLVTPDGVPFVEIEDSPRFPHRALLLDVARNFFPKEFVMKLIDQMSRYKLNRLQLHLTDAQGWRLHIDKYPELTRQTAFRNAPDNVSWVGSDRKFVPEGEPGGYGGYFTKEDIRQIVDYAAERNVTIIPEIEMPGHAMAVFVPYPELSCKGRSYTDYEFCIGNPETYTFLEDVLTEVMEMFPSEYIHIGGDEAGHWAWQACPKCKALMQAEGLKDYSQLQAYLVKRIENFLHSKGRKLIGWDEIIDGEGLPPRATVMSWRGDIGGIKAARTNHDVIMSPTTYMYLDYYQSDPATQPPAMSGYVPIKRVYSFNPVPADSLTPEQAKHILGPQGNLWGEFVSTEEHAEYMLFPRTLAVAEVGWTPQESRDWDDFKVRMNAHIPLLHRQGINAFPLAAEIDMVIGVDTVGRQISISMDTEKYPADIRYTTDGSTPTASSTLYREPVIVKDSAHIKAAVFIDGQMQSMISEQKVDYHKGINKPISYLNNINGNYMAGGMNALLDGYRGGKTYLDGRWQGYTESLDCTVDIEQVTTIGKVSARFMQLTAPGVFQPGEVELLTSENGTDFVSRGIIPTAIADTTSTLAFQEYGFTGEWKARYVRLKASEAHKGQFIFLDEIVIW